jgi:signal transduction histidine kinase
MSTTALIDETRWATRFRYLPLVMLALAAVIALATGPATGYTEPGWRLTAQLVALAASAALIGWWTVVAPPPGEAGLSGRVYFVVRTVLALALTLLNPLYCIFAWIGYIDAFDYFGRRAATAGIGVTAVIMALGQSGGVPWSGAAHAGLFGFLILLNFGLAASLGHYTLHIERTNEERAATIGELEELNAALERAMAENAVLQETVVAQARTAGVQEERQRLAREIHDTIAQALAGVLAQLQAADQEQDPVAVRRRTGRAAALARDALAEARRSVMDLVPAPLSEDSLATAVTSLVAAWGADHSVRADVAVTGDVRALHPEVEATVLRLTQEALANVAKHAAARRVGVTLTYDDSEVILDVRDDGVGFDPATVAPPTSFGLRGMRQRTERLAGALELETRPGDGTALSVRLPAVQAGAA